MSNYRVRIRKGDNEIEVEGDKKYIAQIIRDYGFGDVAPGTQDNKPGKKDATGVISQKGFGGRLSAAEFVLKHQIKKHTDLVLGFGYYIEKMKGLDKFTPGDVTNCYYEAKLDPSNTSQMIVQNIKRGFLMEAKGTEKGTKGRKYYTLTQSGVTFVESGFKKHKA
jgi:hypothetical protein